MSLLLALQGAGPTLLAVDDVTVASLAENIALTQANVLQVQDAISASTAENVGLTQQNTLAVQDATSASSSETPTLTQAHQLAVQDALSGSSAENVVLEPDAGDTLLVVQDALSGSTAESPTLEQANVLTVQDALSSSTAEHITLEDVTAAPAEPNYSPAPQGGLSEGRGSRRRQELSRRLHEAADEDDLEPERGTGRPAKKRKKAKTTQLPAGPESVVAGEARAIGQPTVVQPPSESIEQPAATVVQPPFERSISGTGSLRGTRHPAINGVLSPRAGGEGQTRGERRQARSGSLAPYAVENPSTELLMALLTAA